jgi:hypothetical protein
MRQSAPRPHVCPASGAASATHSVRVALAIVALSSAWLTPNAARAEPSELDPAVGYNYGEIETARTAGVSGAQRALTNSTSALFLNPANMAARRVYHIGALAQIWPEARRQSYGFAAVDSIVSSARVAGGVGGTYNLQDPDGVDRQYNDLRFALAFPFSDQFFGGVGGRYLWLSQDGLGPLGPSRASGGLPDERVIKGFSFDAGLTLKLSQALSLAVVGNNLNDPGTGFQPLGVAGGVGFGTEDFGLEGDVAADFTTWDSTKVRAMLGGELLIADHYPIRAGYRFDEGAESHALSFGLGYLETAFAVDLAVRRVVTEDPATAIVFSFSYHLEATGLTPSAGESF